MLLRYKVEGDEKVMKERERIDGVHGIINKRTTVLSHRACLIHASDCFDRWLRRAAMALPG